MRIEYCARVLMPLGVFESMFLIPASLSPRTRRDSTDIREQPAFSRYERTSRCGSQYSAYSANRRVATSFWIALRLPTGSAQRLGGKSLEVSNQQRCRRERST